jgi:hypothetical protein
MPVGPVAPPDGTARLDYFAFFASAEQVPAPQLAWPAAPAGFFPIFFFGFASAGAAAAVASAAGATAGVAAAEAADAAGAVAGVAVSAGDAAAGAAAAALPLFPPQLAAEQEACPAAVALAGGTCVALTGVCGAGSDPPQPMSAPAPSAARVLANA